jgi:hypothetical protein
LSILESASADTPGRGIGRAGNIDRDGLIIK